MSSGDYDYVYYDMTYNNYQSTTEEPPQLEFKETRNSPIITNPDNYNMSIVRFQLDTPSLPSYIAQIQPNQANRDLMIHSITLTYMNAGTETNINPTYLIWVPVHKEVSAPPAPSANANGFQSESLYYYGYSFMNVVSIINTAFSTAMTALKATVGGLTTVDAPFMYFNEITKTFAIVAENQYFNINNATHIRIYFNRALFGLMNSFPMYRYPITDIYNKNYHIRMDDEKGYNLIQKTLVGSNKVMIELHQEYPTISNFSPITSILFTTTQLPIVPNYISAPLSFLNNQLVSDANQNGLTAQIITDMANNDDFSYKPNLLYAPSAEYRRIALASNRPITNVDIKVWWRDRFGKLQPFYLWSGGKASIKILFEKKKLLK
jgi:hypothetical protein